MSETGSVLGTFAAGKDLGNFEKCPNCGVCDWTGCHSCKPSWEVIRFGYHDEDNPETTYGNDAGFAALKFVSDNFSHWEYPTEMEIWVRKDENDDWHKFDILVETVLY